MSPNKLRYISAQYVLVGDNLLKRGIVTVGSDGVIINVEDTGGDLEESRHIEFYNGILVPGFVNCHCHLELSGLKGVVQEKTGLPEFLATMRRSSGSPKNIDSMVRADREMYDQGIVLCGDICNSTDSFPVKSDGKIKYHNFIELFGSLPISADARINAAKEIMAASSAAYLPFSVTPHSVYSVSVPLMRKIKELGEDNRVSSIHFMESVSEREYINDRSGKLADSFKADGLFLEEGFGFKDHITALGEGIMDESNLILVHNTFVDLDTVATMVKRPNTYWCLCPNSNLYIEDVLPPLKMLMDKDAEIVIGTDSLASNNKLSVLEEIMTLQRAFPELTMTQILGWATINGAKALGRNNEFGSIEAGKRPGLLLLEGADLINLRLLPGTTARRLI
jgi:cytosine/adenosine deaminase-related metal-dependent hydrolase